MQIPPKNSPLQRLLPLGAAAVALLVPAVSLQAARTAYYQFDNAAEPGLDSAGGDDTATKDGGERITTGALSGAGAWLLDGKTPGFTIAQAAEVDAGFTATENFSVSGWFRLSAATGRQRIFSTSPGWGLGVDFTNPGNPRLLMTAYAVEDKFLDAPEVITGKWFHVAVVVMPADQNGIVFTRVYLNGVQLGEDDGPYNSATGNLLIGSAGNGFEGFNGALDELAYYDNALSETDVLAIYNAGVVDTDKDGLPDYWESAYGLDPNSAADASLDLDQDGLPNKAEYDQGMLPNNADTDADGLKDGVEDGTGNYVDATKTGTDPKNPDTDGDTILDGAEKAVSGTDLYATDPNNADTDGDLLPDNYEVFVSKSDPTNALDPAPVPNLVAEYRFELPNLPGLDSSGGDDSGTESGGTVVTTGALAGTGAYSLSGTTAGLRVGTGSPDKDPDLTFTENFTISAWCRVASATGRQRILSGGGWGLGVDFSEPAGNPAGRVIMTTYGVEDKFFNAPDIIAGKWAHVAVVVTPTDESDVVYTQVYVNGVFIGQDDGPYTSASNLGLGSSSAGSNHEAFNGLLDEIRIYDTALTEAKILELYAVGNSDDDKDGMPANWERAYGLNPDDPADAAGDLDGDGLSNLTEYTRGLLPNNKDTDGDGIEDGAEDGGGVYVSATQTGTDPKKADTDGDGIPDGAEKAVTAEDLYSTDPNKADTDGDHYPDGYEVTVLHTDPTNPADPNRPAGLVARYDFEDSENLGADSAGDDDTATAVGGGGYQVTGSEAKIGDGALVLSGTDFLRIGLGNLLTDIDLRATENFSAAAWFKFNEATGRQRILSSQPGWGLAVNYTEGTPAGILLTAYGIKDAYFPADLSAGEWYHVAFSVSPLNGAAAPEIKVYLNGTVLGEDTFLFNPPTNFAIGSFTGDGAPFESFTGTLDDVRYYNTAISDAEAAALYALGGGVVADPSFQITALSRTNGLVSLTFASQAGASYTVQRSAGLSGWIDVGTVNAAGGSSSWSETTAPPAASTHYFYRVVKNG